MLFKKKSVIKIDECLCQYLIIFNFSLSLSPSLSLSLSLLLSLSPSPGLCRFPGPVGFDWYIHAWEDTHTKDIINTNIQSSLVAEDTRKRRNGPLSGTRPHPLITSNTDVLIMCLKPHPSTTPLTN